MRFDDFDKKMRIYEESLDQVIPPDMYIVVRLDGRSFTKFTKKYGFKKPFDEKFRDMMIATTKDLIENSGFRIIYGYTESDEISLLFHPNDQTFGRKVRKINTSLAGQASAFMSLLVKEPVTFDCRIAPLPNLDRVADYFAWRQEDSHRNSLNGWCYWTLRKEGLSKRKATSMLEGMGVSAKNELLFERGINYNNLPKWQRRGVGIYYMDHVVTGYNPIKQENVKAIRRKLYENLELQIGEDYRKFIVRLVRTLP